MLQRGLAQQFYESHHHGLSTQHFHVSARCEKMTQAQLIPPNARAIAEDSCSVLSDRTFSTPQLVGELAVSKDVTGFYI